MAELVKLFRGKVHLENPMCSIYLLEGLQSIRSWNRRSDDNDDIGTAIGKSNVGDKSSSKLLARVVAKGPKVRKTLYNTLVFLQFIDEERMSVSNLFQ
jgi:hypothetical protein